MPTRLIQIVSFGDVAPTEALVLPHTINVNDVPQAPDFIAGDAAGFSISATPTDVTVTNNSLIETRPINVWLELKHSIPRQFGAGQITGLVPRPFVASSGVGVAYPDIFDDPTSQGPTSPNPGLVRIGPPNTPSGATFFTGNLVVSSEIILTNIQLALPDPFVGVIHNLALGGSTVWVFNTGAGGTLTGIKVEGPNASRSNWTNDGSLGGIGLKMLINDGVSPLTLAHDQGSDPANRFKLPNNVNKVIPLNGVAFVGYLQGGWRLIGV